MNAKNRILVVVDFSAWLYMTIFNAFNTWSKKYRLECSTMVKPAEETDQTNVPNLLISESFKKELKGAVMKKLHYIDWILKRNCQDTLDAADEIVTVFAEDDFVSNNFRRKLFPGYKASRGTGKASWNYPKVRDYVVNSIFPELDLDKKFGYVRIRCKDAEADDVIAVMMKDNSRRWLAKILISSDHDFCQLEGVQQYNVFGDEVIPWVDKNKGIRMTPKEVKLIKALVGDGADEIPQTFPRVGVKTAWKLGKDPEKLKSMLLENGEAAKQFALNRQLTDFDFIPEDLKNEILAEVDKKIPPSGVSSSIDENVEFDLMSL